MLKNSEDSSEALNSVYSRAKRKELAIVTSTITLVEVNRATGDAGVTIENQRKINEALDPTNGIYFLDVTRDLAELARDFVWTHSLRNYDATHLATAIYARNYYPVNELHSTDNDLLRLNGVDSMQIFIPTLNDYPALQEEISGFDQASS